MKIVYLPTNTHTSCIYGAVSGGHEYFEIPQTL